MNAPLTRIDWRAAGAAELADAVALRRAIPSAQGDVAGMLVAFRALLTEAEANRVMTQAAA